MKKALTKELKISLLKSVKNSEIDEQTINQLNTLFGKDSIEIQVINDKTDLEYYEEYERFLKENKKHEKEN